MYVCVPVISPVCVKPCCAGAAEEDGNRRPADDPGQSEEGGRDQTLCGTKQSEQQTVVTGTFKF